MKKENERTTVYRTVNETSLTPTILGNIIKQKILLPIDELISFPYIEWTTNGKETKKKIMRTANIDRLIMARTSFTAIYNLLLSIER